MKTSQETIQEPSSTSHWTTEEWKRSRARCTYSRWLYHLGKGESSLFSLAPSHCKSNEPANRGQRRQAPTRCHDLTNHLRIQPATPPTPVVLLPHHRPNSTTGGSTPILLFRGCRSNASGNVFASFFSRQTFLSFRDEFKNRITPLDMLSFQICWRSPRVRWVRLLLSLLLFVSVIKFDCFFFF